MTNTSRFLISVCAAAALSPLGGCRYLRQDMAAQPKNKPLSPSDFFDDGRSERPLVENTVARGSIADDVLFVPKDSDNFPLPVNRELLERGQDRFKIFCSPCHGLQGDGNGMVAVRGMKHPPTFHQERLRQAPNGYFFDNITNGFGAMYGYSAQIPPRDRWAIIAYVRALQLSRNAKVADLPAELREKLSPTATGIAGDIPGGAKPGEIGSVKDSSAGVKKE
jgi:cbb3-type cytochrome c oxidase subunit III